MAKVGAVHLVGRHALRIDVLVLGIEGPFRIGHRLFEVDPIAIGGRRRLFALGELSLLDLGTDGRFRAIVGLEQRIALEFGFHVLHQIHVRQL